MEGPIRPWRKAGGGVALASALALLAAAATLLAVSLGAPVAAGQGADDPRAVRELAERMLDYSFSGEESRVRLLPGQLPADFPFDLPQAPGARLVGSVTRESGGRTTSIAVILDVPGAMWDVHRSYEAALGERGWTRPAYSSFGLGGFQQTSGLSGMFCRGEEGDYLSEQVRARDGGMAEVRLSVQLVPISAGGRQFSPCSQQMGGGYGYAGRPEYRKELLPPLTQPAGAQLVGTSQTGGSGIWGSDAVVGTEMGTADLEAHFGQQLRAADWTRRTTGGDEAVVWSTWEVPGEGEWQGLLIVQETQRPDRRAVSLRAVSGKMEPSGMGVSAAPFVFPR